MFGAVIAPAKLPALRQLADDYQPDLIIHAEVDIAAPLLAAERGLPSVTYGFAQPLDPSMLAALAERVAPLWQSAGLNPDPYAGIYRDRYLDPCPASLQGERGPAAAVAEPIRPEIPGDPGASLPDWAAALGGRPVVYLSLGTVPLFNQPDKFETLLADLAHKDLEPRRHRQRAERPRCPRPAARKRTRRTVAPAGPAPTLLQRRRVPRRIGHDPRRPHRRPAPVARPPGRRSAHQRRRLSASGRRPRPFQQRGHLDRGPRRRDGNRRTGKPRAIYGSSYRRGDRRHARCHRGRPAPLGLSQPTGRTVSGGTQVNGEREIDKGRATNRPRAAQRAWWPRTASYSLHTARQPPASPLVSTAFRAGFLPWRRSAD